MGNYSNMTDEQLAEALKFAQGMRGPTAALGKKEAAGLEAEIKSRPSYYNKQAAKALPSLYAPAYQAISRQFEPQVARARASLGYNAAARNSGVPNIMNRRLQQGAYQQLGQAMSGSTADAARGGLDLMSDLIKRRVQQQYDMERDRASRPSALQTIAGVAGSLPFSPIKL